MNKTFVAFTSGETRTIRKTRALSLIVPVCNEEQIIEIQAFKLIEHLRQIVPSFEIIFVENGSTDRSPEIVEKLRERFSFIYMIRLRKADYSTAVFEGLKTARGKYSIVTGIDYVDLNVMDRCLNALKKADVVICSKNIGSDQRPLFSRLANRSYNLLVRLFFGLRYSDVEGYHGYNTVKIKPIIADVKTKAHLCNLWVLLRAKEANLQVREVPLVVYEKRRSRFMKATKFPYLAAISLIEFAKLKSKGY